MLFEVKDDDGGCRRAHALQDLVEGVEVCSLVAEVLPSGPLDFHRVFGPWGEGEEEVEVFLQPEGSQGWVRVAGEGRPVLGSMVAGRLSLPPVSYRYCHHCSMQHVSCTLHHAPCIMHMYQASQHTAPLTSGTLSSPGCLVTYTIGSRSRSRRSALSRGTVSWSCRRAACWCSPPGPSGRGRIYR